MNRTVKHKVTRPIGYLKGKREGEDRIIEGICETPYGTVTVHSSKIKKINLVFKKKTFLSFNYDGFVHVLRINKFYKPRYLVTLANRFANEIKGV